MLKGIQLKAATTNLQKRIDKLCKKIEAKRIRDREKEILKYKKYNYGD